MGNNKKKKGGAAKNKIGSSPAVRLDAAWKNLKPPDPSITEFPVWYSAPGTKRVESGDVDGLAVRYPKPYVDLVKDSMREVAAALFALENKNESVGLFAQARALFTGGSSLMPRAIWTSSMWPEEIPIIWKADEFDMRTFVNNELIGRGKKGDGSLPHPLIPRGTSVVNAFEMDHDVKVPNPSPDGKSILCFACKYLEQMSEANDEDPDAIPWRLASQESAVPSMAGPGVPSIPVRLEIRAAFGGEGAATET